MQPLVSVMMPAYNAERYIGAAIESMQAQTYQNWQLCIVDDGSTDRTYPIAAQFAHADSRIGVRKQKHSGCPTARNTCFNMAEGALVAKLDADDTHESVRLEQQIDYLLMHDVDIVSCGMNWLKGHLTIPKRTGGMDPRAYMAGTSNGPCCASLITSYEFYEKVGAYHPEMLAGSDGDWNFRAIIAGARWGHLNQLWYNQRRHNKQLSLSMGTMQRQVHQESRAKYSKLWRQRGS